MAALGAAYMIARAGAEIFADNHSSVVGSIGRDFRRFRLPRPDSYTIGVERPRPTPRA